MVIQNHLPMHMIINDIKASKTIWTIGHSTHGAEEFIKMLKVHDIKLLADIRSYPGSKRYPHFNKEILPGLLKGAGIDYIHLPQLGGRRKTSKDSINSGWRNDAFRGYADYMQTEEFKKGIKELERIASKQSTAYMCSEAVWWKCHRSLVSDYLKNEGWTVIHILSITKSEEHPFTSVARIINGKLNYGEQGRQKKLEL
jgi:uncharacterized protein (DUF488 family)